MPQNLLKWSGGVGMKKQTILAIILLLLLSESVQGISCGELGTSGLCIDMEYGLWKEDLKTRIDYEPSEPPVDYWLVFEKITIINKPGSENTPNLSLKIYVYPDGSRKAEIAQFNLPPLQINDTYEVTYLGQNRLYEFKKNGELIDQKWSNINPEKLYKSGIWNIEVTLEPPFGRTVIINGMQKNYNIEVCSVTEMAGLNIERRNLFLTGIATALGVLALILGIESVILSKKANKLADQSDKKMKALADSQIDEKLAIMAEHLKESLVGSKNTAELKNQEKEQDYWLNEIRRIQSDFNAVTDLKEYASPEKKQKLIENYIVPILEALNTIKENIPMSSEWNDILTEIAKTAWTYDIKTETIESFINH